MCVIIHSSGENRDMFSSTELLPQMESEGSHALQCDANFHLSAANPCSSELPRSPTKSGNRSTISEYWSKFKYPHGIIGGIQSALITTITLCCPQTGDGMHTIGEAPLLTFKVPFYYQGCRSPIFPIFLESLCGLVVSITSYECAGLGSNPGQPVHSSPSCSLSLFGLVYRMSTSLGRPGETNTCPVSWGNGFLHHTGSRDRVADECQGKAQLWHMPTTLHSFTNFERSCYHLCH